MQALDIVVLVIYFGIVMAISFFAGRGQSKADDFFLAGRSMPFWPVALSVVATMVGGTTLISAPGWAYNYGLSAFMININIPLAMFICSIVFVPFLFNLKITSVYQYIGKRFGPVPRLLCAVGFLWMCLATAGAFLIAPTMVLHEITGWGQELIILLLLVLVIVYTMAGGLKAVIATDCVQMVVLWLGIIAVFVIAMTSMGTGFGGSFQAAIEAGKFQALNFDFSFATDSGVWVAVFGFVFLHVQYYACDQSQLQRLLSTKDIKNMRKSLNLGGCIYNTQMMVMMLIGLVLFGFYQGRVFESDNDLFITFLIEHMPAGLFGLVVAAIVAGTMGGVDSLLNSMSTVFMKDIYEPITKKKDLNVKYARVLILIFGIGMGIFTYFGYSGASASLIAMIGMFASYVSGSILGTFVLGMFFKKVGTIGVTSGFVAGAVVAFLLSNFAAEYVNWGWVCPAAMIVTIVVALIVSAILGEKSKAEDMPELTMRGQRAQLIKEDRAYEDGVCILPGKVQKSSLILLGFFFFQFVVLGLFYLL